MMNLDFKGEYTKDEIKYICKALKEVELPENDEYLYVGEVTFVATKKGNKVTIDKIKNVL